MKIELEEMKKQKVKMIRKMKDDTSSRKITDARKERYVFIRPIDANKNSYSLESCLR